VKKWFIRIVAISFSLFLLLVIGLAYLLGTENGARFIVSQAENLMGESLQIGTSSGTLLDRLEISDIVFNSPAGSAKVGHLVLDWKSSALLSLHLHILELSADNVSYSAIPQEQKETAENNTPFTLPELTLPISIDVEQLSITHFLFSSTPEAEALTVREAGLAFSWDKSGIKISTFDVAMDDIATLHLTGAVNPTGNYPLKLTSTLKLLSPDLPALTIEGAYKGDLQNLHIQEDISGDIRADISMTLHTLLTDLTWQGDINITELLPAIFAPDIPGTLSGEIIGNGDIKQAELNATLSIRDKTAADVNWDAKLSLTTDIENLIFDIKQLSLKHAETPTIIELSGIADLEQNLDIELQWQQLQWPIRGDADYGSAKGNATLQGTLDAFHLLLTADVTGSELPEGTIQLETDGSTKELKNIKLSVALLDGEVELLGNVGWAPVVKWTIESNGSHINPGVHYGDWPGKLDWKILTDGIIENDTLTSNIKIETLQGNLRDLPISGTGTIIIAPEDIQVQNVRLASGSAVVTANGKLGEDSNLQWQADIADFSDLLPKAGGTLEATGTVLKNMKEPLVAFKLLGSSILYSDLSLEQITADAALDLSWSNPFSITIAANALQSGKNLIKTLRVVGKGSRDKHSLKLSANHDLADIKLELNGGYAEEQWQGVMDTFSIFSKNFGTWKLQQAADISAAVTAASLDTLCLSRESSDLCVKGTWDADGKNTGGDVQIKAIPLSWLSPWFPETLEDVTGLFSAKATATIQNKLSADVTAEITPGDIAYITDTKRGIFPHEGLQLKLQVQDEALDADFRLSVDSNILSGHVQLPDVLQKDIGSKAKLDGTFIVKAEKFDLVETLVPDVMNLKGAIDVHFKILGTLAEPDINGKGEVNIGHVLIPVIGLDLTDTALDIVAKDKEISLHGQFNSPEGSMLLAGNASLDSAQGWPASASLKGHNFRLVNLPEIKVFLSSDILFEKKDGLMSLTGEATIPKADILLRQLPPGSQSASPDMVIIQESKEEAPSSPLHMLLKITLGDNVHFAGFGLNTFIDGQLTILSEPEEQLIGSGAFQIKQGSYRAYGQNLDIETGVISFPGGPLSKPGINLRATRTVGNVVAGIYAIGPASKPRLTTFSNPPMSESSVISYLLTGSSPDKAGQGTKLSIGRQLNNKLSVSVGTDVKTGESEFVARYRLSRKFHVQTTTGANSNAADIFYTIELEDEDLPLTPNKK